MKLGAIEAGGTKFVVCIGEVETILPGGKTE